MLKDMTGLTGVVILLAGYFAVITTIPLWFIHMIYEFIKVDQGFFTIVFANFGLGLLQGLIGWALIVIGYVVAEIK